MTLGSLSPEDKADPLIHFALQVQAAWFLGHYHALFKLYKTAPLSAPHVMNLFIERERKLATAKLLKAYVLRSTVLVVGFVFRWCGVRILSRVEKKGGKIDFSLSFSFLKI